MTTRTILIATLSLLITTASCSKKDHGDNTEVRTPTYQFTTTNWDDGWVSNVKDNWAEVTKGTIKVLLHYPQSGTDISADPGPYFTNAWNLLSASRYSNVTGFTVVSPSLDYERAYMGFATAKENASGQTVFVALFKKGSSGWIEFITPDKNTFVAQFGLDPATVTWSTSSNVWNPFRVMANYNRFAVAGTDVESTGKWTNNFGSNTFYYSLYTGLSTGISSYSSTEEFVFTGGTGYNWQVLAANSAGGSTSFAQAKSSGSWALTDNWNMNFSNIENTARTYAVWFAAIKDGRILFINGSPYSWVGK